jgi:hypothetical protein
MNGGGVLQMLFALCAIALIPFACAVAWFVLTDLFC